MNYASIREMDISNGEGVGVALFVQGCHFHCVNCFNSETWDFNGGKEWNEDIKKKFLKLIDKPYINRISILGGEPLADENLEAVLDLVVTIRKLYRKENIVNTNKQYIVGDKTEVHNILSRKEDEIRISFPDKNIWIYSGYTWEQIMYPIITDDLNPERDKVIKMRQDIVKNCDVLVDGRYIDELRDITLHWRGSSNQRVIDLKETFKQKQVVLYED